MESLACLKNGPVMDIWKGRTPGYWPVGGRGYPKPQGVIHLDGWEVNIFSEGDQD